MDIKQQQIPSREQKIILQALAESVAGPGCRFLEVGSWCGDSAIILGKVAQQYGGHLFCIDWWKGNVGTDLMEIASKEDVFSFFWNRICCEDLEDVVIPIRARSDVASKILAKNIFDLVFFDADHRYRNVLSDIERYAPLVRRDKGILCGHDCDGLISDFDISFLQAGRDVDVFKSIHCGVVLAVGSTFKDYSINYNIWSVQATDQDWKPTNLIYPLPVMLDSYKSCNLVRYKNLIYAIPRSLGSLDLTSEEHRSHPEIFSAETQQEVEKLIDKNVPSLYIPELFSTYMGYNLVKYRVRIYAIPQSLGPVDLTSEEQRSHPEILSAEMRQEAEELIRENLQSVAVKFAGGLPIFNKFGNCGSHPQFEHLNSPPMGYRFVCSKHGEKLTLFGCFVFFSRIISLVVPIVKLTLSSFIKGARLRNIVKFLWTRGLQSQLILPRKLDLVFLPSVPFTFGQHPWVIEIEDTTSLFFPFVHNGQTSSIQISDSPYYPIFKALIESKSCRGLITHIKSTADSIPVLFGNDKLIDKITYVPLGFQVPAKVHIRKNDGKQVNILFSNSWHQDPRSFYLRGGLDLIEAFAILHKKYPNLHLTLRTRLPEGLERRYLRIIEGCRIRIIDYFLPKSEWESLLDQSDIFALPSARIHVVSILEAMANGLAVVVSDGWGVGEYIQNAWNGVIVKGRYGKCSWIDTETGMLKENYEPLFKIDPNVVEGLVDALASLTEDKELREKLGKAAQRDVETKFNIENWNRGLKKAFDKALLKN